MDYRTAMQNNAQGYVLNAPEPIETPSRIRDGVGQAEQHLVDLNELVSAIEKRLDSVLTPIPPATSSGSTPGIVSPTSSHLCGRVSAINEGFVSVACRLQGLMRRVEI